MPRKSQGARSGKEVQGEAPERRCQLQVLGRQRHRGHMQAVGIPSTLFFLLGDSGTLLICVPPSS